MLAPSYRRIVAVLLATSLGTNAYLTCKDWHLLHRGYADFTIFYSAGKIVSAGQGSQLYDEAIQHRAQMSVASEATGRAVPLPYNHPPFEVLLFVPLTYLPYFTGYWVWEVVGLCLVALALRVIQRRSPTLQLPRIPVLLIIALAFFPLFMNFFQGQDEAPLFLLLAIAYVSLKAGADFWVGICLGLGAFRPQIVLPMMLILVLAGKWQAILGFVTSGLLVGAVSVALVGWRTFLSYPRYVWALERSGGHGTIIPRDMPNLRGFVSGFYSDGNVGLAITLCGSLLLLFWAVQIFRKAERAGTLEIGFSAALLASILVSYHALPYDLGLLFLAVLLMAPVIRSLGREPVTLTNMLTCLAVGCLLFAPLQMILWLRFGRFNAMFLILILWMWGMHAHGKQQRSGSSVTIARQA